MFELQQIRQKLQSPIPSEGWRVLATIVRAEGSTYRGAGAKLVIDHDGEMTGVISGGCFDTVLFDHAEQVGTSGDALKVVFDLRDEDDAIFGIGLGCQGILELLLEKVPASVDADSLEMLVQDPMIASDQFIQVDWSDPKKVTRRSVESNDIEQSNEHTFIEHRQPRPRLTIVGCGADALPVVQLATSLGWRLRVGDHREEALTRASLPDHVQTFCGRPDEYFPSLDLKSDDAVLIMSHNYLIDREALTELIQKPCTYIGLLGPKRRGARLREEICAEIKVEESFWQRVYNPVGLDIGSVHAEEIALSAVAEISAVLSHRHGQPLRERGNIER